MFKVECMCDDKKLAKVLWLLSSTGVYNVVSVPVANAQKANGQVKARIPDADKLAMLRQYMAKHKLKVIAPPQIRAFTASIGLQASGYSNVLRQAIDNGVLVRAGKGAYRLKQKGGK